MQQAYFFGPIREFLALTPETILGHLAKRHAHDLDPLQRNSWLSQIEIVQREFKHETEGWVAFEFAIPRMGKRVDAIIVLSGLIFVLEFKIGAAHYEGSAIDQVVGYALDLKNFHAGSHERFIVPLVVATRAEPVYLNLHWADDGVAQPVFSNGVGLLELLTEIVGRAPKRPYLDALDRATNQLVRLRGHDRPPASVGALVCPVEVQRTLAHSIGYR
jgi:hypothetical protein